MGWRRLYRSTAFQIFVVGLCAFSAPGIWNAMNGLGVGGSQTPDLVNAANALLFGFMTVTCFLGPFLTNLVGFKITLALGSIGYPLYAAGLYCNNRFGTTWLVYVGSVACGITAGIFWSVEGAVVTGYPEAHKRGRAVATWCTFKYFGNIVGGAISLALNIHMNQQGQVSYSTYQAFIAIQCLGLVFGLLLSNPEKVIRSDGTKIEAPKVPFKQQAKSMWRLLTSRPILMLAPLFWYFGWTAAYPGTYLATYFSVRSRSLASFLNAVVSSLASWLAGSIVDIKWTKKRRTRAIVAFAVMAAMNTGTWIWAVIIQNEFRKTHPKLDWADQKTFGRGFGYYVFERAAVGMIENYIYWCIGNLSDSPGDQVLYSSLLRGIETAANAISYGVQAAPTALIITAGLNMGFWFLALPFSIFATLLVVRKFDELERARKIADVEDDGSEALEEKI